MNADRIVKVIETVTSKLDLFIQAGAAGEEYYWTAGPNQGIAPKLRNSARSKFKHFLLQTLNSGHLVLPFLFLQAIAYFAHTGLSLISAGVNKNNKEHRNQKLFSALISVITGSLVTLASICILLASAKVLAIAYAVQAGIDVVVAIKELVDHKRQTPNLKNESKSKLGWAAVILVLTVCCFFVPVPIVPIIAQVALAVVATYLLVKEIKSRVDHIKNSKPTINDEKIAIKSPGLWQKIRKLSISAVMTMLIAPAICAGGPVSSYGKIDAAMHFKGGMTQSETRQDSDMLTNKNESKSENDLLRKADDAVLNNEVSTPKPVGHNRPNRMPRPEPVAANRKEEILIETEEEINEPEEQWRNGLRPR